MKKIAIILSGVIFSMLFLGNTAVGQVEGILGMWKTIDDETGKEKSHVKVFKATNGMYYGKIVKLIGEPADKKCTKCKGKKKDKPIVGMMIITKLKIDGKELSGGKILDPGNGKYYHCTLSLDKKNKKILNVRGSIDSWGVAGRTQTWHKIK